MYSDVHFELTVSRRHLIGLDLRESTPRKVVVALGMDGEGTYTRMIPYFTYPFANYFTSSIIKSLRY